MNHTRRLPHSRQKGNVSMTSQKSIILAALLFCMMAIAPSGASHTFAQALTSPAPSTNEPIPPETLDALLAPIALYPDALIIQIVQCASSPYQVKQVSAWLKQNPDLKGTAAQDAAAQEGFDASFVAIVLFPQVVHMMAEKADWTSDLGQAFANDRNGVLDSIQRLRTQAHAVGNLKTTDQQQVETVSTQSGQQVIVIQPANPQVVYVPQYDPQVVYVQPPPAPSAAPSNEGRAVAAGLIGFAAGVIVGAAADDDDDHYYYASGGWGYHGPALCNEGWEDYYRHRENMANDYYDHRENMADDYYDHRENMAGQAGENQASRQAAGSENQAARQESRSANQATASGNQAARQDSRATSQQEASENQAARQSSRSDTQATASQTRSANQSSRQATASESGGAAQANRGATSSRGAAQNQTQPSARQEGTRSGAFSGYQRGSTERASSARGRQSMSGRGGGGGGGGGRSGRG